MTRTYNKAGSRKKDVVDALKNRYGATVWQIAKHMGTSVRTARRYIGELIYEGVVDVKFREVRKPHKRSVCFYGLKDKK